MKCVLTASAVFNINMTLEQIQVLEALALTHYDGVCRSAGRVGGFIYGWKNQMWFQEQSLSESIEPIPVSATFRQLDTCLKILEMTSLLMGNDRIVANNLARSFLKYVKLANEHIPTFVHEVDA